jgi:hypothetical protein
MLNDVHGGSGLGLAREGETGHGEWNGGHWEREESEGRLIHTLEQLGGDGTKRERSTARCSVATGERRKTTRNFC